MKRKYPYTDKKELLTFKEVCDLEKNKWFIGIELRGQDKEVYFKNQLLPDNARKILNASEFETMESAFKQFNWGKNILKIIDGKTYEVSYTCDFEIRQRIFILPN